MNPAALQQALASVIPPQAIRQREEQMRALMAQRAAQQQAVTEQLQRQAMLGGQVPIQQPGVVDPAKAAYAAAFGVGARIGGARDQYVNPAIANYIGGEQQKADLASRTAYADAVNKFRGNEAQIQSDLIGAQQGLAGTVDQLNSLSQQQKADQEQFNANRKYNLDVKRENGLNARNDNTVVIAKIKAAVDAELAKYKDPASQQKRRLELITEARGLVKQGVLSQESFDLVFSDDIAKYATSKFTEAKTKTENGLRNPRLKELAAKLGLIDAQTGAYNALAGKREQETMKIISMADEASLLPEELALVEQSFNPQMESMAKSISQIKLKLQEAQKVLKALGPDDVGYKEAFKDVSLWTEQLRFMESAMKEDEAAKKQAIADAKKGKASAPNGGAYTRINYSSKARGDASRGSINRNLLNDLQSVGDSLGLNVTIGTALSGHSPTTRSGNKSRHSVGNAVDITHINGYSVSSPTGRKLADRLVAKLVESGAIRNSENGNRRAVLWQMQDHYDHIHYSNNS